MQSSMQSDCTIMVQEMLRANPSVNYWQWEAESIQRWYAEQKLSIVD